MQQTASSRRRGAPRKPSQGAGVHMYALRMPQETWRALDAEATRRGTSAAALILAGIERELGNSVVP